MTARELAQALLTLPNPDAPVFCWAPGQYWELSEPHLQQLSTLPHTWALIELNLTTRAEVGDAARRFG